MGPIWFEFLGRVLGQTRGGLGKKGVKLSQAPIWTPKTGNFIEGVWKRGRTPKLLGRFYLRNSFGMKERGVFFKNLGEVVGRSFAQGFNKGRAIEGLERTRVCVKETLN